MRWKCICRRAEDRIDEACGWFAPPARGWRTAPALPGRHPPAAGESALKPEGRLIVVEEMGHKPVRAKLDDPDAYLTEADQPEHEQLKLEPHLLSRRPHVHVHSITPQPVDENVLVS